VTTKFVSTSKIYAAKFSQRDGAAQKFVTAKVLTTLFVSGLMELLVPKSNHDIVLRNLIYSKNMYTYFTFL